MVDDQGELTYGVKGEWRFDKRSYLDDPPPQNLSLPPPGVPESVVCVQFFFFSSHSLFTFLFNFKFLETALFFFANYIINLS